MSLTPLEAGSMLGGENFVSVRKLPWTRAHALPPSAGPPPEPLLPPRGPQSSLPGGEAEPALFHCREGAGVTVFKQMKMRLTDSISELPLLLDHLMNHMRKWKAFRSQRAGCCVF